MGILDSIVEWIATQIMNLLDLVTGSVLGALGCDMSTFLRYFPAAETLYEVFAAIAVGFVLLNLVWQLFKNFGLGVGLSAEDPTKLAIKSILFIFLALFADQIMVLILGIAGTPYDWVVDTALPPIEFSNFGSVLTVIATYSGSASSTVATGYITTAEYKGTVVSSGISSILYTVTYLGTKIEPTKAEPTFKGAVLVISIIGGTALLAALLFLVLTLRKNTTVYKATGKGNEYEKCGRLHLKVKNPELRIDRLKDIPEGVIAIEVDQAVAKKLFGQTIAICCYDNTVEHTVGEVNGSYWFKVDIGSQEGESNYEEEP